MYTKIITKAVEELAREDTYDFLFHKRRTDGPLPSAHELKKIVELVRSVVFPGYYGEDSLNGDLLRYHLGVNAERLFDGLRRQVLAGLCFATDAMSVGGNADKVSLVDKSVEISAAFIEWLPRLREVLATDVKAMYNGDPAAGSYGEVISCYPSVRAVGNYRIAHRLLELGVPLIPRIITELAHGETGIDIHPGARIGEYFTIDHGTGVVIGETCVIGRNVKLYQGVTLGAKSFPLDEDGNPVKGIDRHPILEDDVIVYANATILGRITIGRGAVIGGNQWITRSVEPGMVVVQQ